jgi:K+-sensing histidine kinase KdpD
MSVVGIPLLITEDDKEKAIGALLIDSKKKDDFNELDWEFLETIANYFATIIYNQQLSDERSQMQANISKTDTATEVDIILNHFFHNIKDPLQEIRCAFNILRLNDDEKETRDALEQAEKLSNQMLSITEVYSNNFAKTVSKLKTIEVRKLIDKSLDTIEMTTGLPIPVHRKYENLAFKINCNPVFIQLAFREIINNAIKYSNKLDEKKRYLKIDIGHSADDMISITFESSTYKTIPKEKLEEIFNPFRRASTEESGKGLGLSLAGLCVNLHLGKITARNLEPKNDTKSVQFKVTLHKDFGILKGATECIKV